MSRRRSRSARRHEPVAARQRQVEQDHVKRFGVDAEECALTRPLDDHVVALTFKALAQSVGDLLFVLDHEHAHPDYSPRMTFSLLETMRLEEGRVVRLDRHLARMAASAGYFGFRWVEATTRDTITREAAARPAGCWRVRLLASRDGTMNLEFTPHQRGESRVWRVAFAETPVESGDPFLVHKTTHRVIYELARRERPDVDDVLLWNERGEVTEATIANLVVDVGGTRWTPPVSCGLLPGVFRTELIDDRLLHAAY